MTKITVLYKDYLNHIKRNDIAYDPDVFEEWVEREMETREKEKASLALTKEASKKNEQ
jgi:hypothetical protein